ncbi:MAG: glycosyltransferase family 2 protein [bacterium]
MIIWFVVPALFFWFIGFWILFRILVCKRYAGSKLFEKKVSVIIPARNEEDNLPRLLATLANHDGSIREIIVVDDHSDDNTQSAAVTNGARVIISKQLPDGWQGKSWACQQGAEAAQGDIFVFLDADTFCETEGFEKLIESFAAQDGVLSVNPYHRMKRAYEAFSAFFAIMQMVGIRSFSFGRNREPAGMFGPCLVISRQDYETCGGHESVKSEILEHYALYKQLHKHNIPVRLYGGRESIQVRLYPHGFRELIRGWSKSFAAGANNTPREVMRLASMWISGLCMVPCILVGMFFFGSLAELIAAGALYVLYVLQIIIHLRRLGNFPLWASVAYPIPLFFFLCVFALAQWRLKQKGEVAWKGRNIKVP